VAWSDLSPGMRELIERCCTPKQRDALVLLSHGLSERQIARRLGLSRAAVVSRLENGRRRIAAEMERREEGEDAA